MNTLRQRTRKYIVGVIALSCFGVSSLFAAMDIWGAPVSAAIWSGGDGNWDTDASWGGSEPVSGSLATVNNGDTVTVNQTGEIAGQLQIIGGSTVNVDSGYLTLDAVSQGASLTINGGPLNVDGGTVAIQRGEQLCQKWGIDRH